MISLTLPRNQKYLDPGVITYTDDGLVMNYDDGEEVLLCDSNGFVFDVWEAETDLFIREVFHKMNKMAG